MPATVTKKLECIGDDMAQMMRSMKAFDEMIFGRNVDPISRIIQRGNSYNRAWVTIIKDHYQGKFLREFPRGYKDYSEANSKGSRGVYKYYYLEEGYIYEVSEPTSWKNTNRYFCRIENGQEIEMSKDEVKDWFNKKKTAEYIHERTGADMTEEEYWEWLRKGI